MKKNKKTGLMKKIFISLLSSCLALSSAGYSDLNPKGAHDVWLHTVEMYAKDEKWNYLSHIVRTAMENEVTYADMLSIANKIRSEPIMRAVIAAQNIRERIGKSGLGQTELFRMTLFIETELEEQYQSSKTTYFSRVKTGLVRTIELHPDTGHIFIHLKSNGTDVLGQGKKKIVTKSILYDVEEPELAARLSSTYNMDEEIRALKSFQDSNGIVPFYASSKRKTPDGIAIHHMMCKLYTGGTLADAFRERVGFTFTQKLDIARDLLEGLAYMHKKGHVHRDLNARNVLYEYIGKGSHSKRKVSAAISDFGRTRHIDTVKGVKAQFNSRYLAPEAIISDKLSGDDYFATDIFALGAILHKLYYEKKGPWIDDVTMKNPTQPDFVKEAKMIYDLENYRKGRLERLAANKEKSTVQSTSDRFEGLILQMIDPDPESRGTAEENAQTMREIIADFQQRARQSGITETVQDTEVWTVDEEQQPSETLVTESNMPYSDTEETKS